MPLRSIFVRLRGLAGLLVAPEDPGAPPSVIPAPGKFGIPALLFLIAAVLFGVLLRIDGIGRPIWIDEANTLSWTHNSWGELLCKNFSPLMPAVAKAMTVLCHSDRVGDEVIVRIPGIVWGDLTLLVLFLFVWKRAGTVAALVATLFLGASCGHILISLECRYYAFQTLMSLLLIAVFETVLRNGHWRHYFLVALVAALGILNHLTFVLMVAALTGAALLWIMLNGTVPMRSRLLRCGAIALAAGIGASSPVMFNTSYLNKLVTQVSFSTGSPAAAAKPVAGAEVTADSKAAPKPEPEKPRYRLTLSQYADFLVNGQDFIKTGSYIQLLLLAVMTILGLMVAWNLSRPLAILCLFGLVAVPAPLLICHVKHPWLARYFTTQFPIFALLAGLAPLAVPLYGKKWSGKRAIVAVLLLVFSASVFCAGFLPAKLRQYPSRFDGVKDIDALDVLAYLGEEMHAGDTLAVAPMRSGWFFHIIMRYYLSPSSHYASLLPSGINVYYFDNAEKLAESLRAPKTTGNRWVIAPLGGGSRDEALLSGAGAVRLFQGKDTAVWACGGSMANMLSGGDFESAEKPPSVTPDAQIVTGDGAWQNGASLKVQVPPPKSDKAVSRSIAWFPVVRSGVDGAPASQLEGGCAYTLSFRLKTEGFPLSKSTRKRIVRIVAADETKMYELLSVQDPQNYQRYFYPNDPHPSEYYEQAPPVWKKYEIALVPGKNVPSTMRNVKIGFWDYGVPGTIWLDNVQLEAGTPASPFTPDVRTAPSPSEPEK